MDSCLSDFSEDAANEAYYYYGSEDHDCHLSPEDSCPSCEEIRINTNDRLNKKGQEPNE